MAGNFFYMNINKDWIEDPSLENGKYLNQCLSCRELFIGHKRRVYCKECNNMNPQTIPDYIKPGAFVKLRDGSKARIYAVDGTGYNTVHGAATVKEDYQAMNWNKHGNYQFGIVDSVYDIIGPWIDKPDCSNLWPLLPPWIKWLAMRDTGEWRGYTYKPVMKSAYWDGSVPDSWKWYITIPKDYAPIYSGDWKDSLVERPQ